ncbi:MAG: tRNA dihydrouridine synthase [Thermoplasmatota archaeon]
MILGLDRPLVLSPMVDVTDAAFRSVASEWGADITCSEMVSAAGLVNGNRKSWHLVTPWPGESPYGVQLMGGDPDIMGRAVAQVAERIRPDFIDLNLGCPSPNILRSCAGGFLLNDPKQARRVIQAATDATDIPVTVKMRIGPTVDRQTFLDVGLEAQAAGAAWCTLHGRTVAQGYSGNADWTSIARLVDGLDIPVIGNGDLRGPDDVLRMREDTDCAGFFIARAAMHDPTIFRPMRQALDGSDPEAPADLFVRLGALTTYLDRASTLGEVPLAVLKRQVTRFLSAAPGAKKLRAAVHAAPDAAGVRALLEVARLDHDPSAGVE